MLDPVPSPVGFCEQRVELVYSSRAPDGVLVLVLPRVGAEPLLCQMRLCRTNQLWFLQRRQMRGFQSPGISLEPSLLPFLGARQAPVGNCSLGLGAPAFWMARSGIQIDPIFSQVRFCKGNEFSDKAVVWI